MINRRLFISQPFTGYDETELKKQREILHKVFCAFISEKPENVELINQLDPCDRYDVKENFRSSNAHDLYRFCRSIAFLGLSTDIVLYGDWEKSRGCKLEVEILKQFGIDIIDQNLLIAFCIKNNMLTELEELWPKEAEKLRGCNIIKSDIRMFSVKAIPSPDVDNDEIVISYASSLSYSIPSGTNVCVLKFPTYGQIVKLHSRVTIDSVKFPYIESDSALVYVSPMTASLLCMDIDQCGNVIHIIIPEKDTNEPSEEEIQKVLDNTYPLCVIKDRYCGTYSGGEYTAWRCGIGYIPDGVFEDDVECATTWSKLKARRNKGEFLYGVGETPDEALNDLAKTIIRNSEKD